MQGQVYMLGKVWVLVCKKEQGHCRMEGYLSWLVVGQLLISILKEVSYVCTFRIF
mgnify:CR=1 FL=1